MTGFGVVIEKDSDGYFAHIPSIQGCYAQGDTYEKVIANIQEVLHLILEEDGAERGNKPAESIQDFTIGIIRIRPVFLHG